MNCTRREALAALAAAGNAAAAAKPWKPKLGILCRFSESNIEFARQEGFRSLQLGTDPTVLNPETVTDAALERVRNTVRKAGLYLSSIGETQNHIAADPGARAKANARFAKAIEMTGRLGVPYIATASGKIPEKPLQEQVDEIVRVYNERYFPVCQKYNVRILWEPWVGGPNVATGPVGFEALFKAFGGSPYVGLQYDPSHLQWQMICPVQAARDFVDRIYDVHLKDTEIFWPVLRRVGVQPLNRERWWRFRLPGHGIVDWKGFFTVLADAGYQGAMNIEHEDELYYPAYQGSDFTPQFKDGFRVAHQFLKQLVPA
ncbi:MAG: sugar phosphate isomerase/epimerase [Bryobacterales bacterium]|nr:sugar phosphate isomerase/epimerase [Bryobacterales bacterium]